MRVRTANGCYSVVSGTPLVQERQISGYSQPAIGKFGVTLMNGALFDWKVIDSHIELVG